MVADLVAPDSDGEQGRGIAMSLHKEINLEVEICEHLAAHGWRYTEGDASTYDRARALFAPDVIEWASATHPQAWSTLVKNHGVPAEDTLLARLRDQIDQRSTLDVLRHGVELLGLRQPAVHLPFADLRLRQHRHREARHFL
jgi:type I restriction enzyme R subunit